MPRMRNFLSFFLCFTLSSFFFIFNFCCSSHQHAAAAHYADGSSFGRLRLAQLGQSHARALDIEPRDNKCGNRGRNKTRYNNHHKNSLSLCDPGEERRGETVYL